MTCAFAGRRTATSPDARSAAVAAPVVPIGTTALSVLTAQAPEPVSRSYAPGAVDRIAESRRRRDDAGTLSRPATSDSTSASVRRRQPRRTPVSAVASPSRSGTTGVRAEIARRHNLFVRRKRISLDGASHERGHPRRARIKEQHGEARLSNVDDEVGRRRVRTPETIAWTRSGAAPGAVGTTVSDSDARWSSDAITRVTRSPLPRSAQRHVERPAARTASARRRWARAFAARQRCAYGVSDRTVSIINTLNAGDASLAVGVGSLRRR
jgi:hypothetical protein